MQVINTREQKGVEIARTCELQQNNKGWIVPSQSGGGNYLVKTQDFEQICTCPDYELRKIKCKHVFAVEYTLNHQIDTQGNMTTTKTVKLTYAQDWSNYDKASINQKPLFLELLHDLC